MARLKHDRLIMIPGFGGLGNYVKHTLCLGPSLDFPAFFAREGSSCVTKHLEFRVRSFMTKSALNQVPSSTSSALPPVLGAVRRPYLCDRQFYFLLVRYELGSNGKLSRAPKFLYLENLYLINQQKKTLRLNIYWITICVMITWFC